MEVGTEPLEKGKLIRFFVPLYDQEGEFVNRNERDEFIKRIKKAASEVNGGYTTFQAEGGYLYEANELVEEPILVIETYGQNPLSNFDLYRFNRKLAQECVITMEGRDFEAYIR